MQRNCILLVIVAMMITCCNAIDQVKLSKTKIQNPVQTDSIPINDRNDYQFLRSYKTVEDDIEERAWNLKSLKSLIRIKKSPNDFSKKNLERMMIDPKFKKEMIEKWGTSYTQEKVISKLKKKDPAMLLDFLNGHTALRPLIKVDRPQNVGKLR